MDTTGTNKKIGSLSVEKVKAWIIGKEKEYVLLDVRQPEEYRSGHLPGAVFLPLPDLIDRVGELDPQKSVVVYCRSGNRSRAAAAFLLSEGFSDVYSMDGGLTVWNGRVATGSYEKGLFLLEGRETTEELISVALVFEEGSRMFYESVEDFTSDREAKNIFHVIAKAEAKHKITVLDAYKLVTGKDLADNILESEPLKGIMESGVRIEDTISFLGGPGKTLLDIFEVSMQVETNALDLYIKLFRKIKNIQAKKIFSLLLEEEKRHLSGLGKLLGEKMA